MGVWKIYLHILLFVHIKIFLIQINQKNTFLESKQKTNCLQFNHSSCHRFALFLTDQLFLVIILAARF